MTRITLVLIILVLAATLGAQTKRKPKPPVKTAEAAVPAPTPSPEPIIARPSEPKKNERPTNGAPSTAPVAETKKSEATYFYEFAQPEFDVSKLTIQHDDSGKGTIVFKKKMFDEIVTDPIQVSPAVLERINAAYTALNFLDSTESYQYEKDFSHLGVMTFRLKRAARERTTTFNYTVNKDAKTLADEYRRLGNQYVWIFDIGVSRQIHPLDAPRLLDSLDSLMRRNEISDPTQMVPLLKDLSNDERIPLIARNHAARIVAKIEKK